MDKRKIILFTLLLLIIIINTSVLGCSNSKGWVPLRNRIEFETVVTGDTTYWEQDPMIQVLTDNRSLTHWFGVSYIFERNDSPEPPYWTQQPQDFSEYLLIAAFLGQTGASIKITDIWQIKNTVFIRAQFIPFVGDIYGVEISPVHVVRVKKDSLYSYGQLSFVLLDDYGVERSVTTAVIPVPEN